MMIKKSWFTTVALVALTVLIAVPASAERRTSRVSQGNNIGWTVATGWGMPWTGSGRPLQFPTGSGNFINNDGNTIGFGAYRDLDGDGTYEDTAGVNHIRAVMPGLASLEQRDLILSVVASVGPNAMQGEMGKAEYSRIWSSLDASEVAEWPPEGRTPRTWSGTPDIAAAGETMFFHSGDVWNDWAYDESFPVGAYQGWTLRFLNFAESNNIMYIHQYIRNMSEYCMYNGSDVARANALALPNHEVGFTWGGFVLVKNNRTTGYNGNRAGWAYHPEKEITAFFPKNTNYGGWNPPPAPLIVLKMINYPEYNGETMKLSSFHTYNSGDVEFGFNGHSQMYVGYRWSTTYQVAVDRETGFYTGVINPFTGRPLKGAFPGRLEPTDARFGQWIWGGASNWMNYTNWGELHEVEPRGTFEFDMAIMFVPPGVSSWVMPDLVAANIDDPMMQDLLKPAEDWSEVAAIIVNGGFQVPVSPTTPPLTIVPSDRQVTLTWSDLPLQQTDPYYDFLQENPGLDPGGVYRQYDFEGFRVYRSFVGPNDSHSELLADYNLSSDNLQFYYIDKLEDDEPYSRMRNGMKIWYAVVAYDANVDPATGEAFSLPALESGKTWNRPGEGVYSVIPRSEASNYRSAELGAEVQFTSSTGWNLVEASSYTLAGPGDGTLSQAPVALAPLPISEISLTPILNERITEAKTLYMKVTDRTFYDQGCTGLRQGVENTLVLLDGSSQGPDAKAVRGRGGNNPHVIMQSPTHNDGVSYALEVTFNNMDHTGDYHDLYANMALGGYAGGSVNLFSSRYCGSSSRLGTSPSNLYTTRAARFEITWAAAGDGELTVQVKDLTRNIDMPHVDYPDEWGWGFQVQADYNGVMGGSGSGNNGTYYNEAFSEKLPKDERTVQMKTTMPADNTLEFGFFINGLLFSVNNEGGDGITMPSAGTVWTLDNAYGSWNGDKTEFTQYPNMAYEGDQWAISVSPMTLDAEDADLSRIKVVPNPYMASSFLDLSPANRRIEFVNLPDECTIRIYTLSGNLVNVLNHIGINRNGWGNYTDYDRLQPGTGDPTVFSGYDNHTGTEPWNLRNRFGQIVASGLYLYHVTDQRGETFTGKFYIVN